MDISKLTSKLISSSKVEKYISTAANQSTNIDLKRFVSVPRLLSSRLSCSETQGSLPSHRVES